MIFPEGLTCEAEFEQFAKAMTNCTLPDAGSKRSEEPGSHPPSGTSLPPSKRTRPYLLANMTEFGKTPMIPLNRFAELGYDLVIYPVTTLRITMKAVAESLAVLKDAGTAASILDQMQTRSELYDLLGYTPGVEWTYPNPTRHE